MIDGAARLTGGGTIAGEVGLSRGGDELVGDVSGAGVDEGRFSCWWVRIRCRARC
jgi:hypothetical protein